MKTLAAFRLVMAFTAICIVSCSLCAYELSMRVMSLPDVGAREWSFESVRHCDNPAVAYHCYGDTLLNERIEDRCYWYALRSTGAVLIKEETSLMEFFPDTEMPAAVLGVAGLETVQAFTGRGHYCRKFALAEEGEIALSAATDGVMVMPSGVRRHAVMTAERRSMLSSLSPDSAPFPLALHMDSLTTSVRTVYRWHVTGNRLPVAVMLDVESFDFDGSPLGRYKAAYVLAEEAFPPGSESEEAQDPKIVYENDKVIIRHTPGASVSVSVSTDGGICETEMSCIVPTEGFVEIDVRSLGYGRHVVAVDCGGHVTKFYFTKF